MIKKSLFEQELEAGMQRELRKQASVETPDLVKAAECLHAAIEIFEEAGMTAKADAVLAILEKIATNGRTHVQMGMPSVQKLMGAGLSQRDLQAFSKGDPIAKAKFNLVMHQLGFDEKAIVNFIGRHNYMSQEDAKDIIDPNRNFGKMWEWMKDPTLPTYPEKPQPGETLQMDSVMKPSYPQEVQDRFPPGKDELTFKSLLNTASNKHRKPKNPGKVSDWHTKGLTPEKMVENLKHHGTEFNMADDMSADLDPDIAGALGVNRADDLDVDVPQGDDFEDDWLKWQEMVGGGEEAPPTQPSIPVRMKSMRLEDLHDASDFTISDDVLEVDEKDLPQDFEDERD